LERACFFWRDGSWTEEIGGKQARHYCRHSCDFSCFFVWVDFGQKCEEIIDDVLLFKSILLFGVWTNRGLTSEDFHVYLQNTGFEWIWISANWTEYRRYLPTKLL
jgi:hypothetical protein